MAHDLLAAGNRRQRHAAADDLAERAQVGGHAISFLRAAIGQPEPGHHLVKDQHNAMLVRLGAKRLEEAWRWRDQPLQRLDDDAGDVVAMLVDQGFRKIRIIEGRDKHAVLDAFRNAGRIRHRTREILQP